MSSSHHRNRNEKNSTLLRFYHSTNSREQSFNNCGETMANVIKGKGVIGEEKARKTKPAFD